MKLYKYETHCHTAEGSKCSKSPAKEMARKYKELGYDGIIVTDHFFNGNSAVPYDLPWKERIDLYYKGYEHAKEEGDKIGLKVFFGIEWTYHGLDFLTYNVSREWLYAHPEIEDMQIPEYINLVHEAGGFVIHAHPFREASYIHEFILCPYLEDAVEVYNTSHRHAITNDRAKAYAESFGLIQTSGSDAHSTDRMTGGGILFKHPVNSIEELVQSIKNGEIAELGMRTLEYLPDDYE